MDSGFLTQARVLIFDFDGTLVDSNSIKRRAFEVCFGDFPEHRREILRYCHGNNHTPRGEKFRYVMEKIIGSRYTPQIARRLHRRFEMETTRQVIEAPERAGAFRFLSRVARTHRTGLLSSTPDAILRKIVRKRGWSSCFDVIRGAPVDKAAWLKQFCRKSRLKHEEIIFFGDTEEDAAAAEKAGFKFVGVANPKLKDSALLHIRDFRALAQTK